MFTEEDGDHDERHGRRQSAIPGPAGDKLRSTVAFEATQFKFTADAAVDGKPAKSPRWLTATGESSDGERCKAVSAQPPPPTQTTISVPS
jgi:hypothetical protein